MQRYAAVIEYNGSSYSGWQRQPFLSSKHTIQECLEIALSKIANHSINITCAGRTDAGVHALGQVIHFDSFSERELSAWLIGTNRFLPSDIRICSVLKIDNEFDARRSAILRHYRYLILNRRASSALFAKNSAYYSYQLNEEKMHMAAQCLVGEHDFSSFRSSECQAKTPFRRIDRISVLRKNDMLQIDICGNAFLHHMVRNIVGSLLLIGRGKKPTDWLEHVLLSLDRRKAGETAPAQGLYLYKVDYPNKYKIPSNVHVFME